jgi:solute carrier family 10 (sodium/bile acid cotransporter), member 2
MVSQTEQLLLGLMIGVIMLGMGASLTWRDFVRAFKRPWIMVLGIVFQFGVMPLLGFLLAWGLNLPPVLAIALIIMASMPGGATSNIFTYFAKGDLALSVTMTAASTLAAAVLTPLAVLLYGSVFMSSEVSVGFANLAVGLLLTLVPVAIGVLIILFLIVTWVPRNYPILATTPWQVYAAVIGIGLFGFLTILAICTAMRMGFRRASTVSLEIGIQNGPLALSIVLLSFPAALASEMVLIPALYSLFIVLSSTLMTIIYRRGNERRQQRAVTLL